MALEPCVWRHCPSPAGEARASIKSNHKQLGLVAWGIRVTSVRFALSAGALITTAGRTLAAISPKGLACLATTRCGLAGTWNGLDHGTWKLNDSPAPSCSRTRTRAEGRRRAGLRGLRVFAISRT